jgi:anti-sigma regulatory factor (Ser/Thr protein kinase)
MDAALSELSSGFTGAPTYLTVSNDLAELRRVRAFIETSCGELELTTRVLDRVILVAEELITNVIEHGLPDRGHHDVGLALSIQDGELRLVIEDGGRPFNPLGADAPKLDLDAEHRPERGLGIHLVRNVAQSMEYERRDGRNRIAIGLSLHP